METYNGDLGCCKDCKFRLDIKKADYSTGGCKDTDLDGFLCLAFADEGIGIWMTGMDERHGLCECYAPSRKIVHCKDCRFFSRGYPVERMCRLNHSPNSETFSCGDWKPKLKE